MVLVKSNELMKRDRRIIRLLDTMARDVTPIRGAKLAAALVHRNQIISLGVNQFRTHPFQAKYGKNSEAIYLHAEMNAIRNALNHVHSDDLTRASLYVYRVRRPESRSQNWICGSSRPCEGCAKAISVFGIKRVINSTNEENTFEIWQN